MLQHFWREHPSWRLGQIVSNAARITGWPGDDVFMVEDVTIWYGLGLITGREIQDKKERDAAKEDARAVRSDSGGTD